jgi:anti-sigma-K factor RskA
MKQELHTLVGAYAIDALDDLERRRFEEHLAECGTCALETRGLREAATRLGTAVATPPPAGLRQRVLSDISQVRRLPPRVPDTPVGRRAPWLLSLAAAACLVVAVIMGGVALRAQQRASDAEAAQREIAAVLAAADSRSSSAPVSTGGTGAVVASPSQDKAVVVLAGLARLPESQTYELWLMGPSKPRPIGLAGKAGDSMTGVDAGLGDATQIGLTVEPAGGSDQPTSDPIFMAPLPG